MWRWLCRLIGHRWHPRYFWGGPGNRNLTLEIACTRCHDYYLLEAAPEGKWELIWQDGQDAGSIRSRVAE